MRFTPQLAMINTKENCDQCGSRAHWWAYHPDVDAEGEFVCQDCARKEFNWKPLNIVINQEGA